MTFTFTSELWPGVSDVQHEMPRSLTADETAHVPTLVEAAVRTVQRRSKQNIEPGTSTVTVPARPTILLPQRPVTAVTSVTTTAGAVSDSLWTVDGDVLYLTLGSVPFDVHLSTWPDTVTVEFTHGWATVPADVFQMVAAVVARRITSAAVPVGARQVQLGAFSMSLGERYSSGSLTFSDDDEQIIAALAGPGSFTVSP